MTWRNEGGRSKVQTYAEYPILRLACTTRMRFGFIASTAIAGLTLAARVKLTNP
jgi:hypothetical protein